MTASFLFTSALARPDLDRFESSISAFETEDAKHKVAEGGTVFVGSSTFTKWTDLEQRFAEFKAINRGFGGSTIPEADYYMDRIISKYKPSRVVLYAGTNDIADGASGQDVYNEFIRFSEDLRKRLPSVELYFISMSMAPSRAHWAAEYKNGNSLIEQYIRKTPWMHYIDVTPVMVDEKGGLRPDLFQSDSLHMTESGYDAWTPVIRQALRNKP